MAQIFENIDDRAREQELAEIIEKSWKCQAVRNPDFAHIDLNIARIHHEHLWKSNTPDMRSGLSLST